MEIQALIYWCLSFDFNLRCRSFPVSSSQKGAGTADTDTERAADAGLS